MKKLVKILQIIPASGWSAHLENKGEADILEPLVCFALVEVSGNGETNQEVRPMYWSDVGVDFCANTSNFSEISLEKKSYF